MYSRSAEIASHRFDPLTYIMVSADFFCVTKYLDYILHSDSDGVSVSVGASVAQHFHRCKYFTQ